MTKKLTVSRAIWAYLAKHGGWVASGELEKQKFLDATGSTISRKARELADEGWLEVEYRGEHNHAHYRAVKEKTTAEVEVPPENTEKPFVGKVMWKRVAYFFDSEESKERFIREHEGAVNLD